MKLTVDNTVNECQVNLGFLPTKYQILIRTAIFLQKLILRQKIVCTLFASDAHQQLYGIFMQFGKNIQTACQLRNAVYSKFIDNVACYCILCADCLFLPSLLYK